ncbi:MAG: hypothetical protein RLZZ591_2036 [Pseudomonadota bacterium]|jgi:diguanylate cyclase (GGDEF)-like protein
MGGVSPPADARTTSSPNLKLLHTPTLLVVATLLMGLMTVVLFVTTRINGRLPGVRSWLWGYVFGFVFCLGFLLRPYIPEWMAVLVTQTTMLLTGYFNLVACNAYLGKPVPQHRYIATGIVSLIALSMYYTVVAPHSQARFLTGSLGTAVLYLLSARTMALGDLKHFPARRVFVWICGGHGAFLMLRPLLFKLGQDGLFDEAQLLIVSYFVILEGTLAVILLAFSVFMLANEAITADLRKLAEEDPLTGICNRRAFLRLLEQTCSKGPQTYAGVPLVLVDLDHFKKINDTWGHQAGDEVLRHFVNVMRESVAADDLIGRLGGEEFAIVFTQGDMNHAARSAEHLRNAVQAQPATTHLGPVPYTVSLGLALCKPGETAASVLHRADEAMYEAKRNGRNRLEVAADPNRGPAVPESMQA